jgi:hypothetical protein
MIQVQQASLKGFLFSSWLERAPRGLADALADFSCPYPDVFAEAAHPFAKLFTAAHGTPVAHILAQAFPASARRLSRLLERAANAALARSITTHAPATGARRRRQHARTLVILVLDQL